jgi:PAS domain S-box-containing protein
VEFCARRTETLAVINRYRKLMLGTGALGMVLSVWAIYIISSYFSKPIGEMVTFARDIASGQEVQGLKGRPSGELGVLAQALEDMLQSLEDSRGRIKDYTDNLEYMVHLRTRALRESEEKYRTLVENVPLVVYRLLGSGKTIFVNQFVEDLLGITQEKVLGGESFWKEKVWPEDRPRIWPLMDRCLHEGQEFRAEYRVVHPDGRVLFVMDHALPVFDESGHVETVDGFLVNVTERYHLQKQIIQTEELRTLSEISARLAHEIRNPLAAAGGFARRVLDALGEGDVNREKVRIVVHEIARLEKILTKTLAYLKPFQITPEASSINELLIQVLEDQDALLRERSVGLEMNLAANLPMIPVDKELFRSLLRTMFFALADICPQGRKLEVSTLAGDDAVQIELVVKGTRVSDDEIEHFFYPFTSRGEHAEALDLPLAKMIVHKHQGLIDLVREEPDRLILKIRLPKR